MKKFFNVAGPCFPDEHYMLLAQARYPALMPLVEQKTYFRLAEGEKRNAQLFGL